LPKKRLDDDRAIQLMVELLAADPSLKGSVRAAAREAAKRLRLPGKLITNEDTLRRKYRRLRDTEKLPIFQSRTDRMRAEVLAEIREAFASRDAAIVQRREQLAAKEQEAASLGLDLGADEDLSTFLRSLEQEMESLEVYARDKRVVVQIMLDQYRSAAEAEAKLLADEKRFNLLQKQVAVVRTVRELRLFFSEVRRLFPQWVSSAGEEREELGEESKIPGEKLSDPGEE
jgi:hypothetical protein